jgi:putative OPT family oligopeptide transporter
MVKSFKLGMSRLRDGAGGVTQLRTDHDLSLKVVGFVALAVVAVVTVLPFLFPTIEPSNFLLRLGIALLVVVFAFFFVTVSARIVGLVGVTSNPTSGMIIATLICTSLIFALFGWTDTTGKVTIIVMGTMVGVAASIAGDASQDIKTGFLLGATPRKQQIGEIIGVLTTAFFVAGAVFLLADQYEIGGPELAAPQANMMKLVVDGIIDQSIPWTLVLVGVGITLVIHFLKLPTLAFAVGVYLPLATMAPVFVGGLIRRIVERKSARDKGRLQKRRESGILFGSGLVGGEGLMGVGIAAYAFFAGRPTPLLPEWLGWLEHYPQHLLNALPFLLLVYLLWRAIHTDEEKET